MKHILISISLSFLFLATQAQEYNALDAKNGFNKFQFGSSLSDVKEIATLSKLSAREIKQGKYSAVYKVKNIDSYNLFEHPIANILLHFYKDQLYEIDVYMKDYKATERQTAKIVTDDLFHRIQIRYGSFKKRSLSAYDKLNGGHNVLSVSGEKVTLWVNERNNDSSKFPYKGLLLQFIHNDLQKEIELTNDDGL